MLRYEKLSLHTLFLTKICCLACHPLCVSLCVWQVECDWQTDKLSALDHASISGHVDVCAILLDRGDCADSVNEVLLAKSIC